MEVDKYSLDELIEKLENIKYSLDQKLNFPKALYSLAIEIRELKLKLGIDEKDDGKI